MTPRQVAKRLGCTVDHVTYLLREKRLKGRRILDKKSFRFHWIVDPDSVKAYSKREETRGRPRIVSKRRSKKA